MNANQLASEWGCVGRGNAYLFYISAVIHVLLQGMMLDLAPKQPNKTEEPTFLM